MTEKLKKYQTMLFVDVAKDGADYDWARIGKSTIFDLVLNANTQTNDYIEDEMPTDELLYYKPTISQELATIKGDKAFDAMYDDLYNLPVGEDAKKKVLLVFAGNIGTADAPKYKAWLVNATSIIKNLNTVDEKILFDLNFGGNIQRVNVTVADGKPAIEGSTEG